MTNLSQNAGALRKGSEPYDDLTRIKGIGEITQQWLRDTFGVYTFRDLANVPPVKIENRLKAEGKITARAKIEEWLAQAQFLADEAGEPEPPAAPATPEEPAWKIISTFVVIFEERQGSGKPRYQTKAHYMEADINQTWAGIDPSGVVDWLVAQLGMKGLEARVPPPAETAAAESASQVAYSEPLAQHIAKAQTLSGEHYVSAPGALPEMLSQPRERAASSTAPAASLYSGKLQQVIAKARSLAGEKEKRE